MKSKFLNKIQWFNRYVFKSHINIYTKKTINLLTLDSPNIISDYFGVWLKYEKQKYVAVLQSANRGETKRCITKLTKGNMTETWRYHHHQCFIGHFSLIFLTQNNIQICFSEMNRNMLFVAVITNMFKINVKASIVLFCF